MPESKPTTPGSNSRKKCSPCSDGPGSPTPDCLPACAHTAGNGMQVSSPPSETGASVGSKRMHEAEESSDEGPSKKQKGKARYIPEPTNFYSSCKQSGTKTKVNMNKVSFSNPTCYTLAKGHQVDILCLDSSFVYAGQATNLFVQCTREGNSYRSRGCKHSSECIVGPPHYIY